MTTELLQSVAYLFDGSIEGLYSAIFASYANRQQPEEIVAEQRHQPRLGQALLTIETNQSHALRVQAGICRAAGNKAANLIMRAALSDEPDAPTCIYHCVQRIMEADRKRPCSQCGQKARCASRNVKQARCPRVGRRTLQDLADPDIGRLHHLERHVINEREHLLQFARFEHLEGNLWFARVNPNANVVPLAMDHFARRFNTQSFIIYDEVHNIAGISKHGGWQLMSTTDWNPVASPLPGRAEDEAAMQNAWRTFYRTIAIESRYNPELRRQLMPMRFWRNLTEMQPDLETKPRSKGGSSIEAELPDRPQAEPSPAHRLTPVPSKAGMKLSTAGCPSCQK